MTLSTQDRMYIEQRISNDAKSALVAYLLWFFLGFIGAHRYYLGRVFTGLLQLCLFVIGWLTAAVAVGLILLAALGLWWIWDAISIPMMIGSHKRRLRRRLEDEVLDDIDGHAPVDTSRWSKRDIAEHERRGRVRGQAVPQKTEPRF